MEEFAKFCPDMESAELHGRWSLPITNNNNNGAVVVAVVVVVVVVASLVVTHGKLHGS